jgi:hypothetical protein
MHGRKLAYKEPQNQGDFELSTKDILYENTLKGSPEIFQVNSKE